MADQKKILFIGSFVLPRNGSFGGIYFACTTIKNAFKTHNIEVIELDTTVKDINKMDVIYRLPQIVSRNVKFLYKILTNNEAKNVFVFLSAGNSYLDKLPSILLAKALGKNVVVFPVSGLVTKDIEKKFYRSIVVKVLSLADKVICQSFFWADFFSKLGISKSKLTIVENWVSEDTIAKSKKLNFPNYDADTDIFKMVYVSRIEEAKGVSDLIGLAKALKDKINFRLDVYGDGSYKSELQRLIDCNGLANCITFNGWLSHDMIQDVANRYHLALFTSRFEGYPNSLLDFIFSKVPVLTTNIPSIVAVVNEKSALYTPGNIEQFTETVTDVRNNYQQYVIMAKQLLDEKYEKNNIDYTLLKLQSYVN